MAWEENSCICLHMQLIAILSRIGLKVCSTKASVFKKDKGGSDSKSDKTCSDKSNKTTKKKPVDDGSQPVK